MAQLHQIRFEELQTLIYQLFVKLTFCDYGLTFFHFEDVSIE